MSGWRIVPVELPNNFSIGRRREYIFATTGLPEPDWEALAGIVLNDDVYDQYATGGEIRRLAAALKAAFGSKP